jgi:hypothetical protein
LLNNTGADSEYAVTEAHSNATAIPKVTYLPNSLPEKLKSYILELLIANSVKLIIYESPRLIIFGPDGITDLI